MILAMKTLITRTITGIVFIALVIAAFFGPYNVGYAVWLFFVFAMIGTQEYLQMISKKASPNHWLTMALAAAVYLMAAAPAICSSDDVKLSWFIISAALAVLIVAALFISELYRKKPEPIINIAVAILPVFWIVAPFDLIIYLISFWEVPMLVLALFILIWAYDTFAYCGGSLFGKHPLFKRISPKKSWEGAVISFVLTSVLAAFFAKIPLFDTVGMSAVQWAAFACVVIVSSTFGDLTESLFKRSCGVKDSGKLLPGHGGVLDRFDSMFFAAPAASLIWFFMMMYHNL